MKQKAVTSCVPHCHALFGNTNLSILMSDRPRPARQTLCMPTSRSRDSMSDFMGGSMYIMLRPLGCETIIWSRVMSSSLSIPTGGLSGIEELGSLE